MKKLLVSSAALALIAGGSFAADLSLVKSTPVKPKPLWTDFYAGLNAGAVFGGNNSIATNSIPLIDTSGIAPYLMLGSAGLASSSTAIGNLGFIGGGQVGYNSEFTESIVFGLEADIQGTAGTSNTSHSIAAVPLPGTPVGNLTSFATVSKGLDYFGTLRGRIGYLLRPNILVFGTGGLAYGGVKTNTSIFQTGLDDAPPPPVVPLDPIGGITSGAQINTKVGWTAGGGLEWMLAQNWSLKGEYLYYDLGTTKYNLNPLAIFNYTKNNYTALSFSSSSTRFNGNIIRLGVNYHFDFGRVAPVVDKF